MLELVVATAALGGAAALLALALPPRGALLTLGATGLFFQALVVATIGIAGIGLQTLHGEALLALALAWLLGAALIAWRAGRRPAALAVRLRGGVAVLPAILREPAVGLAALLMLATFAWRIVLALRLPMVDYDGWSYHLVFGDVWIQHDALTLVPQRIWTAGFPAVSEVLSTWLMAFSHSDAFAGFTTIIPIPLGMVSVAGLARMLGADRRWALFAGLLFGFTPALLALAGTSYVDASSVAFCLATWWLGLRVMRGGEPWTTTMLLGLAGGLAIGTKGTNAPLTAPILTAVGVLLLIRLLRSGTRGDDVGPEGPRRDGLRRLVALVVPVLLFGAVWYVKNWLAWGNPLYPFAIGPWAGPTTLATFSFEVPQLEHLPRIQQIVESWAWDWKLTRYVYNLRPGGIGRAWFAIVPFGALGVWWLLRHRRWAALVFVVLVGGATLMTMPMPWYARETLFVPALGAALAAGAATAYGTTTLLRRRAATVVSLAILALASISVVYVNAKPNIQVLAPGGTHLASPGQYVRYVLADGATRADVSLRKECAGFDQIPAGARVVPGGFNLLHGVVGPNLDRVLTDPPTFTTSPTAADVITYMQATQASWIVTSTGSAVDKALQAATLVRGAGGFTDRGEICQGAHLWQLGP
ncbi:MAG TPA: hypothetical protein VGI98_07750 [Candidatus Limnocylindrales bacterium]